MIQLRTYGITLLAGLLLVAGATSALAAGTAAGTPVSNTASLEYDVGGVPQGPVSSNTVTFLVDQKVDLSMTAANNTSASGAGNILVFTVKNDGNEDQGYALQLFTGSGAEDNFDMNDGATVGAVKVWLDVNKNGAVDGGDTDITAQMGTGANIADLVPDASIQLLVVGDVPAGTPNGWTAAYTLKATTLNAGTNVVTTGNNADNENPNLVQVVLADADAGAGVGASSDGQYNGQYLATGTYTVSTAQLSINKAVAVVSDPGGNLFPNAKAIPGAVVRYTITISNGGTVDATSVVMTDPIPPNTTYVTNSLAEDSGTATTMGYFAGPPANVRVEIPTVNASGGAIDQVVITFDVTID